LKFSIFIFLFSIFFSVVPNENGYRELIIQNVLHFALAKTVETCKQREHNQLKVNVLRLEQH